MLIIHVLIFFEKCVPNRFFKLTWGVQKDEISKEAISVQSCKEHVSTKYYYKSELKQIGNNS